MNPAIVILYFSLLCMVLNNDFIAALTCLPCKTFKRGMLVREVKCPQAKTCKGGLALSICGCCKVCAKVRNEKCGGDFGLNGKCDEGLVCVKSDKPHIVVEYPEKGRCVPKATMLKKKARKFSSIDSPPKNVPMRYSKKHIRKFLRNKNNNVVIDPTLLYEETVN